MPILIGRQMPAETRVEIVRSFSYKLNCGNYESRDFFCSQKAECAAEDAAHVSEMLYQFCKSQVLASVREYLATTGVGRREAQQERKTA
jgi:hypothetical protein